MYICKCLETNSASRHGNIRADSLSIWLIRPWPVNSRLIQKNKNMKSLKIKLESLSSEELKSTMGGSGKTYTLPTVIAVPQNRVKLE